MAAPIHPRAGHLTGGPYHGRTFPLYDRERPPRLVQSIHCARCGTTHAIGGGIYLLQSYDVRFGAAGGKVLAAEYRWVSTGDPVAELEDWLAAEWEQLYAEHQRRSGQ
jgi:hypothetical protein